MMMDGPASGLTDLAMWSLLVGFFLPPAVAIVQQPGWSDRFRAVVTFLICCIAGAGTAYFSDQFDGRPVVSSILLILVTTLGTFRGFWKPTRVAPAIEYATSGASTPVT
jgi:hypothetical protein